MTTAKFIREATLGGPGLCGYAYNADVWCADCAHDIIVELAPKLAPSCNDLPGDTDELPQPIFFGESDNAEHCSGCGDYLYGPEEDEEEDAQQGAEEE